MSDASHVVCWGEVLWDLYPDARRLGGAPANVAVHLGTIGREVTLVSRVGDDELGAEAIAALADRRVDTSLVQVDPRRATGIVGVTLHEGNARYRLEPGRAWEHIDMDAAVARRLGSARAFCFGTLSQRTPHGRDSFARALDALPSSCLRVLDPNLRPGHIDVELLRWSLARADVVKINDDEARVIEDSFGAADAVTWLRDQLGVTWVALTRGARGSRISRGAQVDDHPGMPTSGGDSVGAGDAFTAVLTEMILREAPLAVINEAANRYASFVASKRGATPVVPAAFVPPR